MLDETRHTRRNAALQTIRAAQAQLCVMREQITHEEAGPGDIAATFTSLGYFLQSVGALLMCTVLEEVEDAPPEDTAE